MGRRIPTHDASRWRDYSYELKFDGFRSLAVVGDGDCQLISRRGRVFTFDGLAMAFQENGAVALIRGMEGM